MFIIVFTCVVLNFIFITVNINSTKCYASVKCKQNLLQVTIEHLCVITLKYNIFTCGQEKLFYTVAVYVDL